MSLYVEEKSGSSIPPLAEDSYPAVCIAVVDLGEQFSATFNKWSKKVAIGWEVIGETVVIDGETVPRTFYNTYTASLSTKGLLRKDLISWRGRDFTPEELKRFDLRNILGIPCFIQIVHKKSADGSNVYANLAAVTKVPKGLPAPQATLTPISYDIDRDDPKVLDSLPEWLAKKVRESRTFQMHMDGIASTKPKMEEIGEDDGELPF